MSVNVVTTESAAFILDTTVVFTPMAAAFGGSISALQCMCSVDRVIHYTVVTLCAVFSKDSFNELPGTKLWDHAVELTPDATPKSCKVYPLSASEQKELDAFLKENLESGWI